MIETQNPDIDADRLRRRVALERQRPARRMRWHDDDAPPEAGVVAEVAPAGDDPLAGVKRRVRGIPIVGPVLVRLNAWQRSRGIVRRLGIVPRAIAGARWLKSLVHLNRTRTDLHRTARQLDDLHDLMLGMKATNASEFRRLESAMESRVAEAEARAARATDRADRLHGDLLYQQQRLDRLVEQGVRDALGAGEPSDGTDGSPPARSGREAHVSTRLANVYEAFEDRFRGERTDIKQRQAVYLDPIRQAGAGTLERPVLDIGCGRGEWLELLAEHGLTARGVDINDRAVAICREHGVDAAAGDMFAALAEAGDGALGAVTAFHVIEHLEMETLVDFLDAARTALAPGGALILETPNPENLIVGAHTFHNDPTHKAPIPPMVGQFLVTQRGFADATIWRLHPMADTDQLRGGDPGTQQANRLLYGPQDYAVLARRP
jgi:O-antigen chain-terminating methyltransferase